MKHITYENWIEYVQGNIENVEQYEQHLYKCDQCLTLYMKALEAEVVQLPTITTEEIVQSVKSKQAEKTVSEKVSSSNSFKKKMFHYALAACLTLFLMSTGVFSEMTKIVDQIESNTNNDLSVINRFVEHSISITNQVKKKEVHTHEK